MTIEVVSAISVVFRVTSLVFGTLTGDGGETVIKGILILGPAFLLRYLFFLLFVCLTPFEGWSDCFKRNVCFSRATNLDW